MLPLSSAARYLMKFDVPLEVSIGHRTQPFLLVLGTTFGATFTFICLQMALISMELPFQRNKGMLFKS